MLYFGTSSWQLYNHIVTYVPLLYNKYQVYRKVASSDLDGIFVSFTIKELLF